MMSEQEIYRTASERVDRRNRRWTLWAANLGVMIASVAGVVLSSDTSYEVFGIAFMLLMAGIFVFHTIVAGIQHSRDEEIEKEVTKLYRLRADYEKPKRLHLNEEGELEEVAPYEQETPHRSSKA